MGRIGTTYDDNQIEAAKAYPLQMPDDKPTDKMYNEVYLSDAQALVYNCGAKNTYIRGARALGKTSFMSMRLQQCAQIERSTGVLLGNSIAQLHGKTAPNTIKSMQEISGWVEGVHYFRGHAPKSAKFPEPLTKPRIWENCIHFYTGAVCYLISMQVKASANSMNICWLMGDEARYLVPFAKVREEVFPALRGDTFNSPNWRKTNPLYLSQFFVSDGAITNAQREWEDYAQGQHDSCPEYRDQLFDMLAELRVAQEQGWADELIRTPQFTQQLQYLRSKSSVFFNFSSVENVNLLGLDWIKEMQRQLPPLVFSLQIMGNRRGTSKEGLFYTSFDSDTHTYLPNASDETNLIYSKYQEKHHSYIDIGGTRKMIDYEAPNDRELQAATKTCALDVDIRPDLPLYISVDTNKLVNTMVVAQQYRMDGVDAIVFLRSMYVVSPKHLEDLCEDFNRIYSVHKATCKTVRLSYDSTAKQGGTYASSQAEEFQFYNIIQRILTKHGWKVELIYIGAPMKHDIKYEFINSVLNGSERLHIRINRNNCDYLIASLENSKVVERMGRFRKDKSTEKKPNRTEEEQATDTDMSDAFDTMVISLIRYPRGSKQWGSGRLTSKSTGPIIL